MLLELPPPPRTNTDVDVASQLEAFGSFLGHSTEEHEQNSAFDVVVTWGGGVIYETKNKTKKSPY